MATLSTRIAPRTHRAPFGFDRELLAVADIDGNTPLHRLKRSGKNFKATLLGLKTHLEFLEQKELLAIKNKQGVTASAQLIAASGTEFFHEPALLKLFQKHAK